MRYSRLFIPALSTLLLLLAAGAAAADTATPTAAPSASATPTPTPAATPTPSPTPYAGPTSTITIRFVLNGAPATIISAYPDISGDGVACFFPKPAGFERMSGYSIVWPLEAGDLQPRECSKGPPTQVRLAFSGVAADLLWVGTDVALDVEVGSNPVSLPITGMAAAGHDLPRGSLAFITLGVGLIWIASLFALLLRRG